MKILSVKRTESVPDEEFANSQNLGSEVRTSDLMLGWFTLLFITYCQQ